MPFQIFSGVFDSFREAGGSLAFFGSDLYLEKARERLLAAIAGPPQPGEYVLAPIAASLIADRGRLSILDFGGGPGVSYLSVKEALASPARLSYHIFDNEALCALGRTHLGNEPGLAFHHRMTDLEPTYDLVHFGSVLQYVDDIAGLLRTVAEKSPDYILVSDAMTGTKSTFVTLADYYGNRHPFRFQSKPDMLAAFATAGFVLCLDLPFVPMTRGQRQFYDMRNLPEDCRTDGTRHLMFSRQKRPGN